MQGNAEFAEIKHFINPFEQILENTNSLQTVLKPTK